MDKLREVTELDADQLQAVRDLADLIKDRKLRFEFLAVVNAAARGESVAMSDLLYLEIVGGVLGAHAENVKLTREFAELEARHQEALEAVEAERARADMLLQEVKDAGLLTTAIKTRSLSMTSRSIGIGTRSYSH